jgi:hypothetical protein
MQNSYAFDIRKLQLFLLVNSDEPLRVSRRRATGRNIAKWSQLDVRQGIIAKYLHFGVEVLRTINPCRTVV